MEKAGFSTQRTKSKHKSLEVITNNNIIHFLN